MTINFSKIQKAFTGHKDTQIFFSTVSERERERERERARERERENERVKKWVDSYINR